jgi:hypothetical protein
MHHSSSAVEKVGPKDDLVVGDGVQDWNTLTRLVPELTRS